MVQILFLLISIICPIILERCLTLLCLLSVSLILYLLMSAGILIMITASLSLPPDLKSGCLMCMVMFLFLILFLILASLDLAIPLTREVML